MLWTVCRSVLGFPRSYPPCARKHLLCSDTGRGAKSCHVSHFICVAFIPPRWASTERAACARWLRINFPRSRSTSCVRQIYAQNNNFFSPFFCNQIFCCCWRCCFCCFCYRCCYFSSSPPPPEAGRKRECSNRECRTHTELHNTSFPRTDRGASGPPPDPPPDFHCRVSDCVKERGYPERNQPIWCGLIDGPVLRRYLQQNPLTV